PIAGRRSSYIGPFGLASEGRGGDGASDGPVWRRHDNSMSWTPVPPDHESLDCRLPERQSVPLVVASPHSGALYPSEFLAQTAVPLAALRRAEDAFVDELFAAAPRLGMPLIAARFPRSYVDANREPYELDPGMFEGPLPRPLN